jgi:hypothetical protein
MHFQNGLDQRSAGPPGSLLLFRFRALRREGLVPAVPALGSHKRGNVNRCCLPFLAKGSHSHGRAVDLSLPSHSLAPIPLVEGVLLTSLNVRPHGNKNSTKC